MRKLAFKAPALTILLPLASCGMQYVDISENYVISRTQCIDRENSLSDQYIEEFEDRAGQFVISTTNLEKEESATGLDRIRRFGPYEMFFSVSEKPIDTPAPFIIKKIEIDSSLGDRFPQIADPSTPILVNPKVHEGEFPIGYAGPEWMECTTSVSSTNATKQCSYVEYSYVWPQPIDLAFDRDEEISVILQIEDANRKAVGEICYQAKPVREEKIKDYSIGV